MNHLEEHLRDYISPAEYRSQIADAVAFENRFEGYYDEAAEAEFVGPIQPLSIQIEEGEGDDCPF